MTLACCISLRVVLWTWFEIKRNNGKERKVRCHTMSAFFLHALSIFSSPFQGPRFVCLRVVLIYVHLFKHNLLFFFQRISTGSVGWSGDRKSISKSSDTSEGLRAFCHSLLLCCLALILLLCEKGFLLFVGQFKRTISSCSPRHGISGLSIPNVLLSSVLVGSISLFILFLRHSWSW